MKTKIITRKFVKDIGYHRKLPNSNVVGIYIESDIPKRFKKAIIYHEKKEDELQRKKHFDYKKAHLIATKLEHKKFFKKEKEWLQELNWVHNKYYNE